MRPKKILVPIDFSPFSDYASDFAIFLAQKYSAEITLLHIIVLYEADVDEDVHLRQLEEIIKTKEISTKALFSKHSEKFSEKNIRITSTIERGVSAASAILEFKSKHKFDLIVMGTHGRTGIKNWIYGSVAEKVVRLSRIPVITLHNNPGEIKIKKLIVPVDFSGNSLHGIQEAQRIAKDFAAELYFVHVIEQHIHPSFHAVGMESIFAVDPDLNDISEDRLAEFCKHKDNNAHFKVMEGTAPQTIADYAADIDADIVVMATRGFTGIDHLLIGSTTERLVRIAPCAVLTVGRQRDKN